MAAADKHPKIPMDKVISDELEIVGSHGMQAYKYQEVLEMIRAGKLHPGRLLEKTVSLEESVRLLPEMHTFRDSGVTVIDSFQETPGFRIYGQEALNQDYSKSRSVAT